MGIPPGRRSRNAIEVLEVLQKPFAVDAYRPDCYIVRMFGFSNHAKDRAVALGYAFVKDYVVKPIDENEFKAAIEKYYG